MKTKIVGTALTVIVVALAIVIIWPTSTKAGEGSLTDLVYPPGTNTVIHCWVEYDMEFFDTHIRPYISEDHECSGGAVEVVTVQTVDPVDEGEEEPEFALQGSDEGAEEEPEFALQGSDEGAREPNLNPPSNASGQDSTEIQARKEALSRHFRAVEPDPDLRRNGESDPTFYEPVPTPSPGSPYHPAHDPAHAGDEFFDGNCVYRQTFYTADSWNNGVYTPIVVEAWRQFCPD